MALEGIGSDFLALKKKMKVVRGVEVVRNYSIEKLTENITAEWSVGKIFF
jgi:hypothetical protein